MSATVVLVPCSASHLYRFSVAAAAAWPGATVLVVSFRYGLLELDTVVEPYEQRIDAPGRVSAAALRRQAAELIGDRTVVSLLPSAYSAAVISAGIFPSSLPLAGLRGIGDQRARLARLARLADAGPAVAAAALDALVYLSGSELGYTPTTADVTELADYAIRKVRDGKTSSAHVRDLSRRDRRKLGPSSTAALVLTVALDVADAIAAGLETSPLRRSFYLDHRRAELAPAAEQLSLAL
jgi:hypothetical protein